jgi:putative transposase
VVTYKRRRLFGATHARRLLKRAMVQVRRRQPFDMSACVLLRDHLHCVWTLPGEDDDFPKRWGDIKRLFTSWYLDSGSKSLGVTANRVRHRERGVWQPRYWEHRLRDEEDWCRHRDYIHLNPAKHGYVDDPRQWPWSSIHRHTQLGWLDPDWPGSSPVEIPQIQGE